MKYTEIFKLKDQLEKNNIPHKFIDRKDEYITVKEAWQILYPDVDAPIDCICSCIQTPYSYGGENNLLEISGLLTDEEYEYDSVVGCLTAEEVFERIKKHYEKIRRDYENKSED